LDSQKAFGFGLSYTSFSYKWAARPPPRTAAATDALLVSYDVTVTNTGKTTSDCVVLGFLTAVAGSHADTPLRRLFEFTRLLDVQPGESRDVHFALGAEALRFTGSDGRAVLAAAGRVGVEIGDVVSPLRHELQLL
jgi:beta-D-xylosidase 4